MQDPILVVEDHALYAHSLKNLLRARGFYRVEQVGSAEEALERVQAHQPVLVLIDIGLPGHDGIWLARRLHELQPALPLLMLSGYAVESYVEKALAAGARGYVLKDDVAGLPVAIAAALSGRTYISKMMTDGHLPPSNPPPTVAD